MNWLDILVEIGVKRATADKWVDAFSVLIKPETFSLGFSELDDFMGQVLHESGMLERTVENLNYSSAARIRQVWPSRFASEVEAEPYTRNAQLLANKVYGGRMGNTGPDDGWRYRGRGPIMATGKENYLAVGKKIGVDLVADPDKLANPATGLKAAIAWWEGNVPDSVMGDIVKVTKRVNGGAVGLEHRQALTAKVQKALRARGVI
jgi:putative chitinase